MTVELSHAVKALPERSCDYRLDLPLSSRIVARISEVSMSVEIPVTSKGGCRIGSSSASAFLFFFYNRFA
jgi:hypothetical protein